MKMNEIIKLQNLLKTNEQENNFWEKVQKQTDRNIWNIFPKSPIFSIFGLFRYVSSPDVP